MNPSRTWIWAKYSFQPSFHSMIFTSLITNKVRTLILKSLCQLWIRINLKFTNEESMNINQFQKLNWHLGNSSLKFWNFEFLEMQMIDAQIQWIGLNRVLAWIHVCIKNLSYKMFRSPWIKTKREIPCCWSLTQ